MASSKSSQTALYIIIGVVVLGVVAFFGYYFGVQKNNLPVLATTTSSSPDVTNASEVASQAYAKCVDNGGFVTTARRGTWGYYQVCNFEDDMNCELYALYEGQCPVGGVKTIGYSTTAQVFCALRGGQPMGNENGQCKMPDGQICATDAVYQGNCDSE